MSRGSETGLEPEPAGLTGRSNSMTSQRTSATSGSVYGGRQKQQECSSWLMSCWPFCSMA